MINLQDPKVKERMVKHILFAVDVVQATVQTPEADKEIKPVLESLKLNVVLTVLNFTLAQDWELKNSLIPSIGGIK